MKRRNWLVSCSGMIAAALFGCGSGASGPELATVKGKVTINGSAPPMELEVLYEPKVAPGQKSEGASSMALTDSEGSYVLKYRGERAGAVIGEHTVRVTAFAGGGPAGGDAAVPIGKPIPREYNSDSSIVRLVKKGSNEHEIELQLK